MQQHGGAGAVRVRPDPRVGDFGGSRCPPDHPQEWVYDYENKYQPGAAEEITPAPIPPEWEARLAQDTKTVFDALGLSVYSRADFIVDEVGIPWFLEINTLPGMTPTSLVPQEAAVAGISYDELCETIVNVSMKLRKQQ